MKIFGLLLLMGSLPALACPNCWGWGLPGSSIDHPGGIQVEGWRRQPPVHSRFDAPLQVEAPPADKPAPPTTPPPAPETQEPLASPSPAPENPK